MRVLLLSAWFLAALIGYGAASALMAVQPPPPPPPLDEDCLLQRGDLRQRWMDASDLFNNQKDLWDYINSQYDCYISHGSPECQSLASTYKNSHEFDWLYILTLLVTAGSWLDDVSCETTEDWQTELQAIAQLLDEIDTALYNFVLHNLASLNDLDDLRSQCGTCP